METKIIFVTFAVILIDITFYFLIKKIYEIVINFDEIFVF